MKSADFIGKEAYLAARADAEARSGDAVHAGDDRPHERRRDRPLPDRGNEPIVTPGRRAHRRRPRAAFAGHHGRRRAVARPVPADGLPPAGARRRGHRARVMYMDELYPVRVARVGSRPLFDPDTDRAEMKPLTTPDCRVAESVRQAGAGAGRADQRHRRRAGGRHHQPRLHDEPARGVRGRGGRAARRGPRRRRHRADARPARGRGAAALRRQRRRRRAVLVPVDGPTGTRSARPRAITAAVGELEADGGPFDLVLFGNESADAGGFQVGIRVATALGRPMVNGAKGLEVDDGDGVVRARDRRRAGGLRAPAAGRRRRQGGHQPAALPDDEGPPGVEEGRPSRRSTSAPAAGRRSCGCARHRAGGATCPRRRPGRRAAVVDLLERLDVPDAAAGAVRSAPPLERELAALAGG